MAGGLLGISSMVRDGGDDGGSLDGDVEDVLLLSAEVDEVGEAGGWTVGVRGSFLARCVSRWG